VSGGVQGLLERLKEKWRDFCEKNGLYFTPAQIISLVVLFILLLIGIFLHYYNSRPAEIEEIPLETGENTVSAKESESKIVVHVAGAVNRPGVYVFPSGSRVYEAIQKAGGETRDADTDSLNLARIVKDGERIYLPRKGEEVKTSVEQAEDKLDLNSASLGELEELPGIGEELAKRIVDYREKNGPFTSIEDVMNVAGIGKKKFESIKDKICVK
jgi:competence protein ComEA